MAKTQAGCGNILAGLLNLPLDGPVVPFDEPESEAQVWVPLYGPYLVGPPAYEFHIEAIVYAAAHVLCLLGSLFVLWVLLRSPIDAQALITAGFMWAILAACSFEAIQGVRYGCTLRIFKGYLELTSRGPSRVITAAEVAYFREYHRYNPARRRICLYLKSGERIRLPRVHNPDILWRNLLDVVGIEQMIA